jgi:transcription initiation factor TFIIB
MIQNSGETININNIDNLDDLDNLDCGIYFQDLYNNIIKDTEDNLTDRSKCSRCNSSEFIEDHTNGIIICECGEVINNLYDATPDLRTYDDDTKQENKRYTKITNELLPQSSLGVRLPNNTRSNLKKLQNWGAMPYRERSLYNDFKIINEACEKLELNNNIQQSANIFYAAAKNCKHQEGDNEGKHIITRGKNNKGIQGGCIWISCKKTNTAVSAKNIAEQFDLSLKELNKGIKCLKKLLEIKNMNVQLNVMGSEHYVRKYCTEMNIKEDYMNQAIKIAKNIDKLNVITEHTQFSIAATSILIMAELNSIKNLSKKTLREMFGVSNVTISKTYKKLEKIKHILIDDDKVEKLYQKILKLNEAQELSEDIKKRMEKFGVLQNNNDKKQEINSDNLDESDDLYEFDDTSSDDEIKQQIIIKNKNKTIDKIYKNIK